MTSFRSLRLTLALFTTCALFGAGVVHADSFAVVPPLPTAGPYPIACNNVAQDFSRVAAGEDVQDYWEGFPRDNGSGRYVTDLLADPSNSIVLNVNVPNDSNLYGDFAQRTLPVGVLVCYPTSGDNTRANYALPTGR